MSVSDHLQAFLDSNEERYADWVEGPSEAAFDPEHPAVLVVRAPTDALKVVSRGSVIGAVDRDAVWEVIGFSVDRFVVVAVLALAGDEVTPDWLVEIPAAGFEWTVIESNDAL